ncbi:hypothetical protein, conserved [Eimeria praecox]|uniref:Uncharacterized protein n=1 Tax=Eimeria praecox TaxID=51316 RepID=U6GJE2_9EIME|nr:hypothetical protein, conserved [Eimeria praecox]
MVRALVTVSRIRRKRLERGQEIRSCSSPESVEACGASLYGFSREASDGDESFQDVPDAAEGEVEGPKSEVWRESKGRGSSGDNQEQQTGLGSSTTSVERAGASLWSSLCVAMKSAEETDGSCQVLSHGLAGVAEEKKLGVSLGSEGRIACVNAEGRQMRQRASTVEGASSRECVGFAKEAAETSESFQDVSDMIERGVEEPKLGLSPGRDVTSSSGGTQEIQAGTGDSVSGRNCVQQVDLQEAPSGPLGHTGKIPDNNNGDPSLGVSLTRREMQQSREEDLTRYYGTSVMPLIDGDMGIAADGCKCAIGGSGEVCHTKRERHEGTSHPPDFLSSSIRCFPEAQGLGSRNGGTRISSVPQCTEHRRRATCQQQQLQQVRSPDESENSGLQNPPKAPFGRPLRKSESGDATATTNCLRNSEMFSLSYGDIPSSSRPLNGDVGSHCVGTVTKQYCISSRGSSKESSSGNNRVYEDSESGSESLSSSSDSSTSRSSCSSCCSSESSCHSSESAHSDSKDSNAYETWSSCKEFSSRAFGLVGDTEPPLGVTEGQMPSPSVSTISRDLAPDSNECAKKNKPFYGLTRSSSQASIYCTNYGEGPALLPPQAERVESKEAPTREEVHAGMRDSTSALPLSSSQATRASQQPPNARRWPPPAFGLAAALSSLAHLVFTSRETRTSATHRQDTAPFAQNREAMDDGLAAATPEQRSQGEHASLDAHCKAQGSCGGLHEQRKSESGQQAPRELDERLSTADRMSGFNAEAGVHAQSLKSRIRGTLRYRGPQPALRGNSLPGTAAEEECGATQESTEGHQRVIGEVKKRPFRSSGNSFRKGFQLSKRQLALRLLHVSRNAVPALRCHNGSLLPCQALRLSRNRSAGCEKVEAVYLAPPLPRRCCTFGGAFLPTYLKVGRSQNRESLTSDSSEGLVEDVANSKGSTEGDSFESSVSAAGKASPRSLGMQCVSQFKGLQFYKGPAAAKKAISTEESRNSQPSLGCGIHVVPDEAASLYLTTDSPGPRSFSDTPVNIQLGRMRQARWDSCEELHREYDDDAVHLMNEFPPLGRREKLDFQRAYPGACHSAQPSTSSEPMLYYSKSIGWGGSKPLDMTTTNLILENAVEFALHKHPQGPGHRIRLERLRNEKLKMLLGGGGDNKPSEAHRPGTPASSNIDSLEAHPTPVAYKGPLTKRLALAQPTLGCRMPSHVFCGNFLSAASLWTLQLRRPAAGEEGERLLHSGSSSEGFRKEDSGLDASLGKGCSPQEEAFWSESSGKTLRAPLVQAARRFLPSTFNPLLQELLDFPLFELGPAPASRRSTVVEPSGCLTARTSQIQERKGGRELQSSTMPKPRRPWACGEPVSVAQEEPRPAVRTYIHRPGCRCSLCLAGWGVPGQSGGAPVERHGDTYSSLDVPSPRLQAGLPVVSSSPGGYSAASPMRIISSPLGPYPGYGAGSGNAIRVESPTRMRYGVGESIAAPISYIEHQGNKASTSTLQSVYPVEGLQTPQVQTVSCNDWQPGQQPQIPERMSAHPTAGYPLTAEEKQHQERHSHGRPACVSSAPLHTPQNDPLHHKNPISTVSSRAVSYDELEKLRAQQEQQQKEAEELRRRQEELEKEQNKQREELELERQQLKEQRERLEEQRHAFEQEKQEMLNAQLLAASKGRSRGLESSSGVGKGSAERLPVNNTGETFDLPRGTAARTPHGSPIRHTNSTSNIVRSITGSAFGELQTDRRHGGTVGDADATEEKEVSNTVGGRQQALQPTASCARFFSRTASVDTNDEKEPTLSPQDDLQTDPSMALSTALDKLSKIRMKLDTLQQQLEVQSQEVASYYSALKAADQVHSSLQQTAADCRVCYGRRHTQMQEVEKRLSVLTAQDLHPCSVDELEELAQELEGTQYKLTVVQAQRAGGAAEESRKKPKQLLPYSSSCLPDPKSSFAIPEEPVARIGPDECVAVQESAVQEIKALGDDLEHIKTVHCEYKRAYKRLQGIMTQQINSYDVDLQRLIAIEKNLEEKLRRLLFLNGDANYAELSDAQMQEYFRIVNLSIRKVYREIALRESGDRKRNEPRTSGGWLE